MASTSARFAVWALLVTAASCHEGHEEVEICACAAAEEVHPFTLSTASCADATTLTAAETTLKTTTGVNCQAVIVGTCATSSTNSAVASGTTADQTHAEDCTGTGQVFTLKTPDACDALTSGVMLCHKAFFILQAHHNYCDHDTLSEAQEHHPGPRLRGSVHGLRGCPAQGGQSGRLRGADRLRGPRACDCRSVIRPCSRTHSVVTLTA